MIEMMELDTKMLKSYYNYKYFEYIYIHNKQRNGRYKKESSRTSKMKNRLCKMRILSNEINIAEEKIIDPNVQYSNIIYLN